MTTSDTNPACCTTYDQIQGPCTKTIARPSPATTSSHVCRDSLGSVVSHYDGAWHGEMTANTGSENGNVRHHLGTEFHDGLGTTSTAETLYYYYGHRFYNPELGRWISRDPAEESGGINQFSFGGSDPVLHVDSLGLWKKVGGTIYEAERDEEGLEELASQVSGDPRNWVCIWPVSDSKKWANYRRAKYCAKADVSNLVATSGHSLRMMPTVTTSDSDLVAAKLVMGPLDYEWLYGFDAALRLRDISESGSSPIHRLYLGGHSNKGNSGIGSGSSGFLMASMLSAVAHKGAKHNNNSYTNASSEIGPPKCWFTKNARVYGIGCRTYGAFTASWASQVMRSPSEVYGTHNYVRGYAVSPNGPYLRMMSLVAEAYGYAIYKEYGPKAYGLAGVVALLDWGMVRGTQ